MKKISILIFLAAAVSGFAQVTNVVPISLVPFVTSQNTNDVLPYYHFDGTRWVANKIYATSLQTNGQPVNYSTNSGASATSTNLAGGFPEIEMFPGNNAYLPNGLWTNWPSSKSSGLNEAIALLELGGFGTPGGGEVLVTPGKYLLSDTITNQLNQAFAFTLDLEAKGDTATILLQTNTIPHAVVSIQAAGNTNQMSFYMHGFGIASVTNAITNLVQLGGLIASPGYVFKGGIGVGDISHNLFFYNYAMTNGAGGTLGNITENGWNDNEAHNLCAISYVNNYGGAFKIHDNYFNFVAGVVIGSDNADFVHNQMSSCGSYGYVNSWPVGSPLRAGYSVNFIDPSYLPNNVHEIDVGLNHFVGSTSAGYLMNFGGSAGRAVTIKGDYFENSSPMVATVSKNPVTFLDSYSGGSANLFYDITNTSDYSAALQADIGYVAQANTRLSSPDTNTIVTSAGLRRIGYDPLNDGLIFNLTFANGSKNGVTNIFYDNSPSGTILGRDTTLALLSSPAGQGLMIQTPSKPLSGDNYGPGFTMVLSNSTVDCLVFITNGTSYPIVPWGYSDSYNESNGFWLSSASVASYDTVTTAGAVSASYNPGSSLVNGSWHELTGTYNGANMVFFVDGIQVATAAQTGTWLFNPQTLQLGLVNDGIARVRFWDRVLSTNEIINMVSQVGLYAGAATGTAGITTNWNLFSGGLSGSSIGVGNFYPLNGITAQHTTDWFAYRTSYAQWVSNVVVALGGYNNYTTPTNFVWSIVTNGGLAPFTVNLTNNGSYSSGATMRGTNQSQLLYIPAGTLVECEITNFANSDTFYGNWFGTVYSTNH